MKKTIVVVILAALTLAAFSMLWAPSVRANTSEAKVLSYSWHVAPADTVTAEYVGDLVAVGEIQNVGLNVIGYVDVDGFAYNSKGQLLDSATGVVYGNSLLPGQKAPFYLDFTAQSSTSQDLSWVSSVSTVTVSVSSVEDTTATQYSGLTIPNPGGNTSYIDSNGTYTVYGTLVNNGSQAAVDPWVVATFYNAAGTVIGLNYTNYLTDSLAPGETVRFFATPTDNTAQLSSEIASYSLLIQSEPLTTSTSPTPTPTSTSIPTSTPTPTLSPTSTAKPTPTFSPAPTSTPVVSSTFWSQNQLTLISVAVVVVVGALVPSVYYSRLKPSRHNKCSKLVAKGEDLVKKNDLPQAVECFARASIVGFKTKSYDAAANALERYTATAKALIIKSFLGGAKPEAYERVSKLQSEIAKVTSDKNMQTSIGGSNIEQVSLLEGVRGLDLLIAKARENDLDFMIDEALKAPEVEHAFLGAFNGSDEVEIVDLAAKLGYSVEAAFRLLSKCINLKKIEGYLTSDSKKFISKEYVQKQLSTHLK